jgi:hypothetical protein
MSIDLEKIKIVGGPCVLATVEDVDHAAEKLNTSFPKGYCEYVTILGEGILGDFIRVYPPWRILAELDSWRDRIRQYWFWDNGVDVLTDEQAEESVIIADTLNGDELIFHPSNPDRLIVLPRDKEVIFEAGENLTEALEWLCGSGKVTQQFSASEFEPFDSRTLERSARSESPQSTKEHKQTTHKPHQDNAAFSSGIALPIKAPDQVLQEFFQSLETWGMDAYNVFKNIPEDADGNIGLDEDKYDAILSSVYDKFRETVEPFIVDDFDIGEPCSFGSMEYGMNGPRIVDVQVSSDTAEIWTQGDNFDPSDHPKRLFRLVRDRDSWRVNGMWEITKSGRRKRVKMFL